MTRVVMFSSGISSWAAAKRVAERHGTADLTLLFADTGIEDEDNYRFLAEAAVNVGAALVTIADGRTPWQVFRDQRFLGNNRRDPCSHFLKRQLLDRWLDEHCDPTSTTVYVGMDWTEPHRFRRLQERKAAKGWRYKAPLADKPLLLKPDLLDWAQSEGLAPPRLYDLGFSHANCGGFCVKAGQAAFANLFFTMPERYAQHEAAEEEFRQFLGRDDIAILRDQVNKERRPMTLRQFREQLERQHQYDLFDLGGCGCFDGDYGEAES